MRLDHLLSREPIFVGNNAAWWPFGWCVGCFLVPACVYCPRVGGGCGCVFRGLGIKVYFADEHTVGFTFNTV